jgi:hypothetical protein
LLLGSMTPVSIIAAAATNFITEPGGPLGTRSPVGKPTNPVWRSAQRKQAPDVLAPLAGLAAAGLASASGSVSAVSVIPAVKPNSDLINPRRPIQLGLSSGELKFCRHLWSGGHFYSRLTLI